MPSLQLLSQALLVVLGAGAVKATVILVAAGLIARALRRASAAVRSLVWLAALSACLAILVLPAVTPAWRIAPLPDLYGEIALPGADGWISAAELADQRSADAWQADPARRAADLQGAVAETSHPKGLAAPAWPILLAGLWGLGALLVLARQAAGLAALARLRRRGRPLTRPAAAMARRLAGQMRARAQVLICADSRPPLAFGVLSPCILLPPSAETWPARRLEHVLRHELAHVRRGDAAAQWLASLACVALWFHRLAWHAVRRLRQERELACDDLVLAAGVRASDYAEDLLALAVGARLQIAPAMAMVGPSGLERRLLALLSPSVDRRAPSRRTSSLTLGLVLAAAAPLAAMGVLPARAASPAAAALPAGQIAVSLQRGGAWNLYTVSPDGSNLRALTSTTTSNRFPVWSPDRSRLLFAANHLPASNNNWMEGWTLNVMRPDGSQVTPLYPKVVAKAARAWSPDGTHVAFESNLEGDREIYVVGADGTGLMRLTHSPGDDGSPAWSPDGSRIAFVSSRDGDKEIYVAPARGGEARRLTNHPGDDEDPDWSPDGARIALISAQNGQDQVAVMAADGSRLTRLTADATAKHIPRWSPNGALILFQSVRGENYDMERIELGGGGRLRLTTAPGYDGQASFSPDSRWVVMIADGPAGPRQQSSVYVTSVDGGAARLVAAGPALDAAWSR